MKSVFGRAWRPVVWTRYERGWRSVRFVVHPTGYFNVHRLHSKATDVTRRPPRDDPALKVRPNWSIAAQSRASHRNHQVAWNASTPSSYLAANQTGPTREDQRVDDGWLGWHSYQLGSAPCVACPFDKKDWSIWFGSMSVVTISSAIESLPRAMLASPPSLLYIGRVVNEQSG